jgi:hypothetical protein
MALDLSLSYSQENDLKRLFITDSTGKYSVANTTGWTFGAISVESNNEPHIKDIVYAKLIITDIADTETTIDILTDLAITFDSDTVESDLVYQIDNDDLVGWSTDTEFPDGIYKIEYRVGDDATWESGNYSSLISYVGVYGQIEACVLQAIKNIYLYYDNCNSKYTDDVLRMYSLFIQLKNAAFCGDITSFENILAKLAYLKRIRNINC